jgi:uncharacterized protein (TIGR03437 family)
VNGTWQQNYVLQNGLNLGQQYTIPNYPSALSPATDGLRNITGKVNGDGTVTIWAVTSTVSANGDQGADPNQLVSITDTLANTTAASAATEKFTIVRTAGAGEVYRGIAFAPSSTTVANVPLILSAGSPGVNSIAQGGLAFALGQNLTTATSGIAGTTVTVKDSGGNTLPATLAFASPGQITFQVPKAAATGSATVTISGSGSTTQTANNIQIAAVSPAVFTLDGLGVAAGWAVRVPSGGSQIVEATFVVNSLGSYSPAPINMGSATDKVYLVFYATGASAAGIGNTSVTVNGVNCPVLYSGTSGYPGIDQINCQLPAGLAGSGTVPVQLTAAGIAANTVQVVIQ